ncbi:MAG TPA: hypothetical protein VLX28_22965 [Thermoanaerobaculia bacterium]|nr:hypothetical protein [Thermoanaerobaculia bacterium]
MATVVISGALANKPWNGGEAWVRLSWLLGFRKLGFDVHFVEEVRRPFEANLAWFKQVTEQLELAGAATLIDENGERLHGLACADLLDLAGDADLLVNISGHLVSEPFFSRFRRKAYVDIDPGFTQIWHAAGNPGARLRGHDFYFTIGENIGTPDCSIPVGDIAWRPTRQPVVLEHWPVVLGSDGPGVDGGRFTTVASWRGPYGPIEHGGRTLGLKVHEFRKLVELPERCRQEFEIALNIHPEDGKDLDLLRRHGWHIVDPRVVAPDPLAFRGYVQASRAEFSVAQGVYVETGSGWFSDRTVRYLASGRPALVQDTGFRRNLPVGEGLVPFRTLEEAVAGAERIARDYESHRRAARALAEEFFDSDKVLGRLAEEVGIAP